MTDQRLQFIAAYQTGEVAFAALCRAFGISRKTGYKLLIRYASEGPIGLIDRSRAPHTSPQATAETLVERIVAVKAQHPTWGPRLLRAHLLKCEPEQSWPAASTIGELLAARGLTRPRRRTPQAPRPTMPLTTDTAPNHVWSMDFKGWFRTGDGRICYPFTLLDQHSRYLLRCQALLVADTPRVQPVLLGAFCEYGLPTVLRSDNGPPFASTGLGGLSRLAVWCLKLGVRPEYIAPGRPQQNGRLERFHRTLEADVIRPPAATGGAQQRAFTAYRTLYNTERPHTALQYATPDTVYAPSARSYPGLGPQPFTYTEAYLVRQVRPNGCLKWRGQELYASEALCGETIGLSPLTDQYYALYVGLLPIAILDDAARQWLPSGLARPWLLPLRAALDVGE